MKLLISLLLLILLTSCHFFKTNYAILLQNHLSLPAGETTFWFYLDGDATMHIVSKQSPELVFFDGTGAAVNPGLIRISQAKTEENELIADIHGYNGLIYMKVNNPLEQFLQFILEYGQLTELVEKFKSGGFIDSYRINNPVISFPEGEGLEIVPDIFGYDSYNKFIKAEYDHWKMNMIFFEYVFATELPPVIFPVIAGKSTPTRLKLGPHGFGAADSVPPIGVRHNDNYCAIYAFIHSMETTFPGAVKSDSLRSRSEWDRVGDNIGHSNTFGARAGVIIDHVNKNFGQNPPASRDGKKYCAIEIKDTRPQNLRNWNEKCDVKMLLYDKVHIWGHWLDVDSVKGDTIQFIDYGNKSQGKYDPKKKEIDFSGLKTFHPTKTQFKSANNDSICGNDFGEEVYFIVICECDPNTEDHMPMSGAHGQLFR
ncbi:MAG: hypothetical protein KDD94_04310 [Calditrichaeota bacterium]|nr:hypothetical protein [Calditrichota bacterium]